MKTKIFFLILLLSTTFLLIFFALSNASRNNSSPAFAEELPKNLPTPTPYATSMPRVSAQVLEKYARSEILTQIVSGVEMSATNFRLEKNNFYVDVCFQTPDDNDWIYQGVKIQIGDVDIPPYEFTRFESVSTFPNGQRVLTTFLGDPPQLVSENIVSNELPDYRCDTLGFHVGAKMFERKVSLYINSIGSTPREGAGCMTTRDKVQSVLDANGTDIKIDCVLQESGSTTSIASKPDTLSQEDAKLLVAEAFHEIFTIEGPWIFTGSIE
jgi:hypothetical protein